MRGPLVRVRESAEKRIQDEIARTCLPATFELAPLWKEFIEQLKALGPNPPRELVAKLEAHVEKRLTEIHQKYSGTVPPAPNTFATQIIFSKAALSGTTPDEQGVLELLHWERHKIPLKKDVERSQARDGEAARRVLRTGLDFEALRCDHKRPKPFKGDLEHSNMFEILWGFGIENLTPEALAYFFDKFCPCGAEHDPDNLRKQRARFQKDLTRSSLALAL